jgi:hypothetical protein
VFLLVVDFSCVCLMLVSEERKRTYLMFEKSKTKMKEKNTKLLEQIK